MPELLDATLDHLRALVGFDTRNPPRAIDSGGIFAYLMANLPGFELDLVDHGAGAVSLLARRGAPRLLVNVHMDTVPDSPGWSADPFVLRLGPDRAIGLGACDIKGAAAALLAVAVRTNGPAAFLFSSDEEANDARCIAAFLKRGLAFDGVLVAEPTGAKAVLAHRGITSVRMRFAGRAGHASAVQHNGSSAVHQALRWGASALDAIDAHAEDRFGELHGLRFNIGRIEGGIKPNVIAAEAELRFGMRPLPSTDVDALLAQLRGLADPPAAAFEETFRGPSLPAGAGTSAGQKVQAARALAESLGLPIGSAVDFWTEAALFSQAGHTSLVYGPGDIAQAHAADEWVGFEQLSRYAESIERILT